MQDYVYRVWWTPWIYEGNCYSAQPFTELLSILIIDCCSLKIYMIQPCSILSRCLSNSCLVFGNLYFFLIISTPGGSFSPRRKTNLLDLLYDVLFNSTWSWVYTAGSPGDPCIMRVPGPGENTSTTPCGKHYKVNCTP